MPAGKFRQMKRDIPRDWLDDGWMLLDDARCSVPKHEKARAREYCALCGKRIYHYSVTVIISKDADGRIVDVSSSLGTGDKAGTARIVGVRVGEAVCQLGMLESIWIPWLLCLRSEGRNKAEHAHMLPSGRVTGIGVKCSNPFGYPGCCVCGVKAGTRLNAPVLGQSVVSVAITGDSGGVVAGDSVVVGGGVGNTTKVTASQMTSKHSLYVGS
ncbi:hypothetical protein F4604DRAFT_1688424 [Suillus subluteus]|nr:hypothetical protein F4604DRAFT_1688424 [Suillus subluteus]